MKNLLLILTVAAPFSLISQSFVFCPQIETVAKQGFENIPVSIVFLDSRTYNKKPKEKCSKTEIFQEFTQCIRRTYPGMQLTQLPETEFYNATSNTNFTIKVKFNSYDATFKTGTYNSSTKYEVKLLLSTEKDTVITKIIEGNGKAFNSLGYSSGKSACNKSFKEAFDNFIILLESIKSLELRNSAAETSQISKSDSKADRLRELKKLLDEGVLTQQEFEKEKMKILEEKE